MSYLLDICVVSELVSKRQQPDVVQWIDNVDPESVYLSVITTGEIRKGRLFECRRKAAQPLDSRTRFLALIVCQAA